MTLFPGCHGIFVAQDANRYKERIILSYKGRFSPSVRFLPSLSSFTSPPSLFNLVASLSRKKKFSLLAEYLWSVQDLEDPVPFALHLGSGKQRWLQTNVWLRMQECFWPRWAGKRHVSNTLQSESRGNLLLELRSRYWKWWWAMLTVFPQESLGWMRVKWDVVCHSLPGNTKSVTTLSQSKTPWFTFPFPCSPLLEGNLSLVPRACCPVLAIRCVFLAHILYRCWWMKVRKLMSWANSGRCLRTGKPSVLPAMASQSETRLSDSTITTKELEQASWSSNSSCSSIYLTLCSTAFGASREIISSYISIPSRLELIELIRKPPSQALWLPSRITASERDSQLAT